jgi:serine phosphatase RsbU (regulator of sigma subunit)
MSFFLLFLKIPLFVNSTRRYHILVFVLLSVFRSYAGDPDTLSLIKLLKQNIPDTEKANIYVKLSDLYLRSNFETSAQYAENAITLARKIGYKKAEAGGLNMLGEMHYRKGEFREAEDKFGRALGYYLELHDAEGIAESKNHLGTVCYKRGNNELAIKYFMEALPTFEKLKSPTGLTATYINIGLVYDNLHEFKKAIEFYNKAIGYAKEIGDDNSIASCYNNLGGVYTDMHETDMALECLNRSLKIKEKVGNKAGMAGTLNNIGAIYYEKQNFKLALDYFQRAYLIKEEIDDKNGMVSSLNNIGSIYYEISNYPEAEKYLLQAYNLAVKVGSNYAIDCLDGLVALHKKTGNYKAALEFKEKFCDYKDTLFNIESSKNMHEIQAKFETEKNEKENEILNLQLKNESFVKYVFICVAFLLLLLAFFIFRGLRQKQKANVLLEEKSRIIEQQKHIVEEQNKDITDSIRYAERIQTAIFPPDKMWDSILPDSFVYFRPKDMLSGDFYWVEQKGDLVFVAAADCTGHGVPGALISIVNYNLLNKAVLEKELTDPADILNAVNKWLTDSLHQTFQESQVRDGMDVALCVIDRKKGLLSFAGANNPMYLFNKGGFNQLDGNKFPVGAFVEEHLQQFISKTHRIEKGDTIYLFSDGYADQFGGPKGKKFKYKQLQQLLSSVQSQSMHEQKKVLEQTMTSWRGNLEQIDDILVIGIRL